MSDFISAQAIFNKNTKSEEVKVVVRCRPMTEKEISNGYQQIVEMNSEKGLIELRPIKYAINTNDPINVANFNQSNKNTIGNHNSNETIKQFTFDAVFDCNSKQSDIYNEIMRPIVDSTLQGFNGTIFAYGQTGTGKTYTMEGICKDEERKGIIPSSFQHIFNHIARTSDKQYLVRASYLEIYQEEIRDLLIKDQSKRFELKEKADIGVYVKDLSSFVCKSIKEIEHVMYIGNQNRSVGFTNMNEHSSRSHAIFIVTIEHSDIISNNNKFDCKKLNKIKQKKIFTSDSDLSDQLTDGESNINEILINQNNLNIENNNINVNNEIKNQLENSNLSTTGHIRVGKLNLVDLAGSERQIKTGTIGQRQKEAIKINLSLSALGNVISALVDGKSTHIPYRDSKLTRLLQDSLGGNSKTVMIANIGPASYNYEETLTTLRYANRAKSIKNKPKVNEDPKDALLKQFQLEIERLKMLLRERKTSSHLRNRINNVNVNNINNYLDNSNNNTLTNELTNLEYEKLSNKIKKMESKLLCGGRNIVDHTNEQQRELEHKQHLIAQQKQKEREIKQKLEEQQENTLEIKETFSSLQHEVELKKRKLRKLFTKLQIIKSEIKDSQEANSLERRDLEELQNDLMKELKFKYLVIENFVPIDEKNKLISKIFYDEESEDWKFMTNSLINNKNYELKRLMSSRFLLLRKNKNEKLKVNFNNSMIKNNLTNDNLKKIPLTLRYKNDNNLILNLIDPIVTVKSYKIPSLSPTIKAALDSALDVDDEILIDASLSSNKPQWLKNRLKSIKQKNDSTILNRFKKEFKTKLSLKENINNENFYEDKHENRNLQLNLK